MDQPTTVDALYEAWNAKLVRENASLRLTIIVALVALVIVTLLPHPPKEAPK